MGTKKWVLDGILVKLLFFIMKSDLGGLKQEPAIFLENMVSELLQCTHYYKVSNWNTYSSWGGYKAAWLPLDIVSNSTTRAVTFIPSKGNSKSLPSF